MCEENLISMCLQKLPSCFKQLLVPSILKYNSHGIKLMILSKDQFKGPNLRSWRDGILLRACHYKNIT